MHGFAESPSSVVVKGKGNYTGTCEKTFTISARSMSDSQYASEFMIQAIPDQYYLGKNEQVKPTITVQREGEELKLGTDYTVQYYNNTTVSTDSSKAKVTVYGKGNYKYEISAEYNIVKVPMDNVTISDIDNWTKLGTAPNPAFSKTVSAVSRLKYSSKVCSCRASSKVMSEKVTSFALCVRSSL